jgi:hypothetical protein
MRLMVFIRREGAGAWGELSKLPLYDRPNADRVPKALAKAIGLYLWDRPAGLRSMSCNPARPARA